MAFLFTWVKLTRLALPDRAAVEGISTSLFLPLNRSTLIREASFAFTYGSSSVPPSMTPSPRKCPLYRNVSLVQSVYRKCNTGHFLFRQTAPHLSNTCRFLERCFLFSDLVLPFRSEIRISRSAWPSPPLLSLTVFLGHKPVLGTKWSLRVCLGNENILEI